MKLDNDRIDKPVPALLYLGLHDGTRAWKSFDRDATDRFHQSGYVSDPEARSWSVESRGARAEE